MALRGTEGLLDATSLGSDDDGDDGDSTGTKPCDGEPVVGTTEPAI